MPSDWERREGLWGIKITGGSLKDVKAEQKLKWWPSLQDYNEAIQMPLLNLQDVELKNGAPYTTPIGLPRAVSGMFASVYRMHCNEKDYALRFFLRNIENQSQRYALISDFVQHHALPWTVTFDFLEQGVKSRGEWFPALKMDWVEGKPFEEYLIDNLKDETKLAKLAESFVEMMAALRSAGIAHGDLQHGNIIICENELRLVDYDGMFVPAMQNFMANELGHPNYQHPKRSEFNFGPYLDNFSAWVIYTSLKGLQHDPALLNQLGGADDCLLFRKTDFLEPLQSPAFAAFERHENIELQNLGRFLRSLLDKEVHAIPYLQPSLATNFSDKLAPISEEIAGVKSGPRLLRANPSDWLESDNLGAINAARASAGSSANGSPATQKSWIVQPIQTPPSAWVKPQAVAPQQYMLPEELRPGANRNDLKFIRANGSPPEHMQWVMLANPLMWIMLYYLLNACTVDENLRERAVTYDATISRVLHFDTEGKNEVNHHIDVQARYIVDGKPFLISNDFSSDNSKFKEGLTIPVHALPSNPSITEPLGSNRGSRQTTDLLWAALYAAINLLGEAMIWMRPLADKRLVRSGTPVIVAVKDLYTTTAGNNVYDHWAVVQYECGPHIFNQKISLTVQEYARLNVGSSEIGLIDPEKPKDLLLYKFSLYKPVSAKL